MAMNDPILGSARTYTLRATPRAYAIQTGDCDRQLDNRPRRRTDGPARRIEGPATRTGPFWLHDALSVAPVPLICTEQIDPESLGRKTAADPALV